MIWAKRDFEYTDHGPYQDMLAKMMLKRPALYRQFIMVSLETDKPCVNTHYIGVPNEGFMLAFDGFEVIPESELPREIDCVLVADTTTEEFRSHFDLLAAHLG